MCFIAKRYYRFKAKLRFEALHDDQAKHLVYIKKRDEFSASVRKLNLDIAKLNLEQVDFEKLSEIMARGITLLGQIQQEWTKLRLFFSKVAVRVGSEVVMLTDFTDQAMVIQDSRLGSQLASDAAVQVLADDVNEIYHTSISVSIVANEYVKMAEKYVAPQLAGLPQLLGDSGKAKEILASLRDNAAAAIADIEGAAQRQRDRFEGTVSKELAKLTSQFNLQYSKDDAGGDVDDEEEYPI